MHNFLWLEILVIIAVMIFFSALIANFIYKKVKGEPTGECACCALAKKKKLVKQYHKAYK
jgi:hypothetical protein